MKTKWDTAHDIASIVMDAICVICGAYMASEFYHDVEEFKKRG